MTGLCSRVAVDERVMIMAVSPEICEICMRHVKL